MIELNIEALEVQEAPLETWEGIALVGGSLAVGIGIGILIT